MKIISTKDAADQLGVNVQKFHRLASRLGIDPVAKVTGKTGAKMWSTEQVEQMRAELRS